jgi:methyl-accepting chemotaxis protein
MATHFSLHIAQEIGSCSTMSGTLRQPIQTQQEMSEAIQKLSEQIRRAADQLAEQCDLSSSALSIDVSWSVRARRKPN